MNKEKVAGKATFWKELNKREREGKNNQFI